MQRSIGIAGGAITVCFAVFLLYLLGYIHWQPPIIATLTARNPQKLLAEADYLAHLGNWEKARPYFAKAERLYAERGDQRNELYAKISCVEADVEKGSYTQAAGYLNEQLKNPIVLMTEGLGQKKFYGRIVLLVNEHTVSAGEMITAFAAENKLATIVGTETAGRLLGGMGFKVGKGYLVILPRAAFYTWQGKSFEGHGVTPDVQIPWSPEDIFQDRDGQLEKAAEVVKSL